MSVAIDAAATVSSAEGGHEERHEVKFATYSIHRSEVQHWLHMHPAGFIQPYPDRQVNNLYFDTFDYRAYAENMAGVSERNKVRYRWYGDSAGPGVGSLEVKQKRNYFGWKLRYAVPDAPYHAGATWAEVQSALRAQIPQDAKLWLDQNPLPVIINRYARQYFCTADSAIRATIDTRQRVFDQRNGNQPNFDRAAIMQDSLVVEFKFSRSDRHRVVEMLSGFPIRVARHSKFMNGTRAVGMA